MLSCFPLLLSAPHGSRFAFTALQPDARDESEANLAADVSRLTAALHDLPIGEADKGLRQELLSKVEELKKPYLETANSTRGGSELLLSAEASLSDSSVVDLCGPGTPQPDSPSGRRAMLESWLNSQTWSTFSGAPGKYVRDVSVSYVTVRGTGTAGGLIVVPGNSEAADKCASQGRAASEPLGPAVAPWPRAAQNVGPAIAPGPHTASGIGPAIAR